VVVAGMDVGMQHKHECEHEHGHEHELELGMYVECTSSCTST
jgi:hypothetical protein